MSIRKNTYYNLLGALVPLLVAFVTIPLFLKLVGEARYGVLVIFWLFLGYFGVLEFGLGPATAQRMARLRNVSRSDRVKVFWTALGLATLFGLIAAALVWPVSIYFFTNVIDVDESLRAELKSIVPWLAIAVPIAMATSVLGGALQGLEHFLEINLATVIGSVVFQVAPVLAAMYWGTSLAILVPAALFGRLITLMVLWLRCRSLVFGSQPIGFSQAEVGGLMRFGGWVSVSAVLAPLMTVADRLAISAMSGVGAVSVYSIPYTLAEKTRFVADGLSGALFPRLASVSFEESQRLGCDALAALSSFITPLVLVGIIVIEPFLNWWISPEFAARSAAVGQVVMIAFWLSGFSRVPYMQLRARGRPQTIAKCHMAQLLPYVLLLYLGLAHIGLIGAALAFLMRMLSDFGLMAGYAGIGRIALQITAMPSVLLVIGFGVANFLTPGSQIWWVCAVVLSAVTAIWCWYQAPQIVKDIVTRRIASTS